MSRSTSDGPLLTKLGKLRRAALSEVELTAS